MISIALCDDIAAQLDLVEEFVEEYIKKRDYSIKYKKFSSGEAVLKYVLEQGSFDIYILDMVMPGIGGIDLAKELRSQGDQGKIIYLTANAEYAVESYSVQAFFYLLKPIGTAQLTGVLDAAIEAIGNQNSGCFTLKTRSGERKIDFDDILYIDIVNRCLRYHLKNQVNVDSLMLRIPFQDALQELLKYKNFTMCGSRIVVNLDYVDRIDSEEVTMKEGESLYPPRTAVSSIRKEWKEYLK